MMKKTGAILLLLLIMAGLVLPGADAAYMENQINITSGEYYDTDEQCFFYPINLDGGGGFVYASVANGMVVNGIVRISADLSLTMQVFRNGEEVIMDDDPTVTLPGVYRVIVTSNGKTYTPLNFTIISANASNLNVYNLPTEFQVVGLYLNEEEVSVKNVNEVTFEEDGFYRILYECRKTGLNYELSTYIDHTAPTLALPGVDENGVARGAVDISDAEYGCSMLIRLDGEPIAYSSKLTQSGVYYINITDAAGNSSEYTFRIRVYLTGASILFIGLILVIAIGIMAYLLRERKNFKVR